MVKPRHPLNPERRPVATGALRLLAGVSASAVMLAMTASPAAAQLARLRALAGTQNPSSAAVATPSTPSRPQSMVDAIKNQQAMQNRAQALASYIQQAQAAARASAQNVTSVTDGISARGLNPIAPVLAVTKINPTDTTPNAAPSSTLAVNDSTGLATWDGAGAPVQTTGSNGAVTVTVTQNQQNALLSWQSFNVGTNTTLVFSQKQNGVAQPGWTVVNRVVDPGSDPTRILGTIKADGTVLILNHNGVIFGATAQVNLNALIASSLELGNFAAGLTSQGQAQYFVGASIAQRNIAFLQNGLLVSGVGGYRGQLLSQQLQPGKLYDVNAALPNAPTDLNGLPLASTGTPLVMVEAGATITSGAGGYIILAGPQVTNAGTLTATDGQVSLQGGTVIGATPSSGSASSADPYVRGLILSTQVPIPPAAPPPAPGPDQGIVINTGIIQSRRGYISLGTGVYGTVTNSGLLEATTSVSRNGMIALTGGTVTISGASGGGLAGGVEILADDNGETIPQGTPDSPPAFKTSQVVIGDSVTSYLSTDSSQNFSLLPSVFAMGGDSFIYAPGGTVTVGHDAAAGTFTLHPEIPSGVTIASGATIDVAGLAAVEVAASTNTVTISPAKQNELRDTPNYRAATTDGSFTLNGQTLYVDARIAGTQADGVAWLGSPLVEAASAASQIPVSAAQLLTKAGRISIDIGSQIVSTNLDPALVPRVSIAKGAVFDIAGGWVTYDAGYTVSSQLITASGGVVDISQGDPNGDYVAVVDGFTASQPHFGISQTYYNAAIHGVRYNAAYDEGRDAGALQVIASEIAFDGTIRAGAFAGANQLSGAIAASAKSAITGDPRLVQYSKYQLPAGGLFRIGAFSGSSGIGLGQDIVVSAGGHGDAPIDPVQLQLDSTMLSKAGLSALMLQTSGQVALTGSSALSLAAGGVLEIDAGRSVAIDGSVRIADGKIAVRTYQLSAIAFPGIGEVGNPFRSDDDIAAVYAPGAPLPADAFNITVGGQLDVSGNWTNDYIHQDAPLGAAYINGGSISLTVAPRVFVAVGAAALTAAVAGDLSGSIAIRPGALLDASAGGYVSTRGVLKLTATGGSVGLIDQTTYASVAALPEPNLDTFGSVGIGQGVAFTPVDATANSEGVSPAQVPTRQTSTVKFAPDTIRAFGFGGGGTFTLVSPDIAFAAPGNALPDANATVLPLDFLQSTGFGTLDLTAWHSRLFNDPAHPLFDNGSAGVSAFFDTTRLVIADGQTLNLSQALLPSILDQQTSAGLLALDNGAHMADVLAPFVPQQAWYAKAATLHLRGLMELDIAAGGTLTGAPQATVITPKLYNAGTIRIIDGAIEQVATLPPALNGTGIGLSDTPDNGFSAFAQVFGATNARGEYQLGAANVAGLMNADGTIQTNNQIFATAGNEHFLYFLGQMAADQGIVLAAHSVTDLSGGFVQNPAGPVSTTGTPYVTGQLYGGGTLMTAAAYNPTTDTSNALFANPQYGFSSYPDPNSPSTTPPPLLAQIAPRTLVAQPGSVIDVSGTAHAVDVADVEGRYVSTLQWSNGGTIALLAGGTLSGAEVHAAGGAPQATGGTLEWLHPTIRAADDHAGTPGVAYADQITGAGFATLVADGGLTLDGQFTLSLPKALLVQSAASISEDVIGTNAAVIISATAGTNAKISAPYINFSSRQGTAISQLGAVVANSTVTFDAGVSGLDVMGGILFDASIANLDLTSKTDVRLIGVDDRAQASSTPVLDGQLVAAGNITFDAGRVYTTTGTGNLQRILEDAAGAVDTNPPSPYLLAALGTSSITFLGDHMDTTTPYSAGSYLVVQARTVTQNGYLAAPLGKIAFGTAASPDDTVTFGAGSVTSVSGAGISVPYGTTTDLSKYFFTPGTSQALSQLPSGALSVTATNITVEKGGTVNGSGGGDVYAFEFVSGTGGSRDVLSRFNTDPFSANGYNATTGIGYQYADQRQVYALVPAAQAAKVAYYDPIYSADYSASPTFDNNGVRGPTNLYGANAGLAVTLDGGAGIAAGQYVLTPAHYALLPGAYRIVQNTGSAAPAPGSVQTLRDGSIVMGGTLSTAGTDFAGSARLSFTIQSQTTFLKYSNIQTTSGTTEIANAARAANLAAPALPLDAARVVLDPLGRLQVDGLFNLAPATGGRGSEVDILGKTIIINASGESASDPNALVLSNRTLANLSASSLLIGGQRTDNSDDTTTIGVTATSITVGATADIQVPDLILAVGGKNSNLVVASGAKIVATGTVANPRGGDLVIQSSTTPSDQGFDVSGIGSLLQVTNGSLRLVDRQGAVAAANANRPTAIDIRGATVSGTAVSIESSGRFGVANEAAITATSLALSANDLSFGAGGTIDAALEAKLASGANLTLASNRAITFAANTTHVFQSLTLDGPGLGLFGQTGGADSLTIKAGAVRIGNSAGVSLACGATGAGICGTSGNVLNLDATSLTFASGKVTSYSFDGAVNLSASAGVYVEGNGSLALGAARLNLTTPFVIDRAAVIDPNAASPVASDSIVPTGNYTIPVRPDYTFATTAAIALSAPAAGGGTPTAEGLRAPGATIRFGTADAPVAALGIDGTAVTATAGVIDVRADGAITLAHGASLATPGYARSYGNSQDVTTVSAGGGTVNLLSNHGDITLAAGTAIAVDNGIGNAGTVNLIAGEGAVSLGATLNAGVTGTRGASILVDSARAAFDLDGFATTYGTRFEGAIAIHTGVGDLTLGAGHGLTAASVSLGTDGGSVMIAGSINTAGVNVAGLTPAAIAAARVNGGPVALFGMNGVTLAATARIDTHTAGYGETSLQSASAGDLTIGIGNTPLGAITIAQGAVIDLSASATEAALAAGQTGNRLVKQTVIDPATLVNRTVYQFVGADTGGKLELRAPVVGAGEDQVNISVKGSVVGAASRSIEGYKTWDLDQIANAGVYDGVGAVAGGVSLSTTSTGNNILSDSFVGADGTVSVPWFVQHFGISASDGSSLAGFRLQPGINLTSAGSITLTTNWNLAAGTLNTAQAVKDGYLTALPELGTRLDGTPYYAVVAGSEGALLAQDVAFTYRVGGKAGGEAGVLTLSAGGNLDLQASITDGFFTFADKSDANWINYQLGGSDRAYDPAFLATCGSLGNCGQIATLTQIGTGTAATAANTLTIDLTKYSNGNQNGRPTVLAPYDPEANFADAQGNAIDPLTGNAAGDPIGFATLFPRLPDGSVMHSTSIRLVAGATASADPLHVDRAVAGTVTVEGEQRYQVQGFAGQASVGSAIDLKLALNGASLSADPSFALDQFIAGAQGLSGDSYTTLAWGASPNGTAEELRTAAASFFAGRNATFTALASGRTGSVTAALSDILAFLATMQPTLLADVTTGGSNAPAGLLTTPPVYNFGTSLAYSRSLVRTGDGSIAVAASGDIDLGNAAYNTAMYGTAVVYRDARGNQVNSNNPRGAQVGGTAIYTAGVRAPADTMMATIAGTTTQIAVTPTSTSLNFAAQSAGYIPSIQGYDPQAPVVASGGGSVALSAGGSVLALRDVWGLEFLSGAILAKDGRSSTYDATRIGDATQRWRVGTVGQDTEIAVAPKYFTSGIGTLGGGDVTIAAGDAVTDLTVALDAAVTTSAVTTAAANGGTATAPVMITLGHGDLTETVGGNLNAGQIDLANGSGTIAVGGNVVGYGKEPLAANADPVQYLQVRIANSDLALSATGSIALAGVSALGAANGTNSTTGYFAAGFYMPAASFSAVATGSLDYNNNRANQTVPFQLGTGNAGVFGGSVLPPGVTLAALTDNLVAREQPMLLYPSVLGSLNLFSAGNIEQLVIAMSDSAPSLLPGAFSAAQVTLSSITATGAGNVNPVQGLGFGIPGVDPSTTQSLLYLYHDQNLYADAGQVALRDSTPVRVFAGIDIRNSLINVPKPSQIIAGRDITDLYFTGQNLVAADTTVVQAGRDILGTTASSTAFNLPYVVSSNYVLGGPGELLVQAGRNLGPFINSATVNSVSYAGGIETVGNLYNPWLGTSGADLTVLFGVGAGIDYTGFRDTYLNPDNFAKLDGTLFVQTTDTLGNKHPVRSQQIYAPILAQWLRSNAPAAFSAVFGAADAYPDTTDGNAALTAAAYGKSQALYQAFIGLPAQVQNKFLINKLYFNELAQAAEPTSPSYLQYFRGYWAIDALFSKTLGYTDNLSAYTIAQSSISADHPLGVPTRNLVDGQPVPATQVGTGNADLRLATVQTGSGGTLTILGPGGNFIAGSVVRTSTQAASRVTRFGVPLTDSLDLGAIASSATQRISAIPIGYEGVLTLNGGAINAFTDGSFLVNQSRVFTEAGGDIVMWSSNGNLNAGQGPRSASSFPPVTVNTNPDGYSVVDSAGSVSGAGIGAFQRSPADPASSVILIAPAGLVDAGDAGVRATGDVLVAAARVANADSFSAGGSISGVPARVAVTATAPTNAASSAAAAQAATSSNNSDANQRPSIITVDSLGFAGSAQNCVDNPDDPNCRTN